MLRLRLQELHPLYATVSAEEAHRIANLGATVYESTGAELRKVWEEEMSADEGMKADMWRKEGAAELADTLRTKLAAGEAAITRMSVLEASVEAEVDRRLSEVLSLQQKEFELSKRMEVHALETQIAEMRGKAAMVKLLEEAQVGMREMVASREAELAKYKTTKSSHALGKIGEATMLDMLNSYVIPQFAYSEVKDMTTVKHKGDFHLWVLGPSGKRVKIMIDVKKYASPVQTCEVDKLYSDLSNDDADVGMMVSLDSPITAKTQFQIVRTTTGKPCMFLSFDKLDDGIRQEVLCWAVRVIVGVATSDDNAKQDEMIAKIQTFMSEMSETTVELDGCMKACKALHESLRGIKERFVMRISTNNDSGTDSTEADTRCKGMNASGAQCKSRRIPTKMLCARHDAQLTSGKIVHFIDGSIAEES